MPGFAEVGARSNFTLLDGASHPSELVASAAALGHAGIGICDTNSLAGVVRGHVAAKEIGIPFINGARLVLDDGAAYLVWPTDRTSYGRLTRLISLGRMRAPKGQCELHRDEMLEHADGWVMAAIPPSFPEAPFADRLKADARDLRTRLAMPLLCSAPVIYDGADRHRLEALQAMASAAGTGLLATTDPRYHHPDRRRLADVLTAIRLGVPVDRIGFAAERNGERSLKPATEMARLFADCPEALANSLRVLETGSGFSLDQLRHEYPEEILEEGRSPLETLTDRAHAAAHARWPDGVPPDIEKRIAHELALIEQLDYAPYFLTVDEIVRFARSKAILCQGRGSAANSTICYVLGITAVDPSKHDLLFERFVSAKHALRLGFRLVSGLSEDEGRAIAKARRSGNGAPYGSVEEVARRANVSRRAMEALAEADAFARRESDRARCSPPCFCLQKADWAKLLLAESGLGEAPLIQEPADALPAEADGQSVLMDYAATGLTLRQHRLALLRPTLAKLGYNDARRLNTARPGTFIRLPGLVLMRQRPGTAKGIVFVTLEDEFGVANLVVYANIGERDRAALVGARLMLAEGRIERETEQSEIPITHLICTKLLDRSDLLQELTRNTTLETPGKGRPRPGNTTAADALPESRNFR